MYFAEISHFMGTDNFLFLLLTSLLVWMFGGKYVYKLYIAVLLYMIIKYAYIYATKFQISAYYYHISLMVTVMIAAIFIISMYDLRKKRKQKSSKIESEKNPI